MEVKRESRLGIGRIYAFGFNPCFDGSEARGHVELDDRALRQVSILVLMEVKREWAVALDESPHCLGFNPCFDGSEAREWNRSAMPKPFIRFQSLF